MKIYLQKHKPIYGIEIITYEIEMKDCWLILLKN